MHLRICAFIAHRERAYRQRCRREICALVEVEAQAARPPRQTPRTVGRIGSTVF